MRPHSGTVAFVRLPTEIRRAIVAHAEWAFPEEACGLLAADESGRMRMAYCLSNVERSASRFTVDPVEHFRAMRHAESLGWHLAGSFHSHPHSEAVPSATDLDGALDPEWVYVIAGPVGPATPVRCFRIVDGAATELEARAPA